MVKIICIDQFKVLFRVRRPRKFIKAICVENNSSSISESGYVIICDSGRDLRELDSVLIRRGFPNFKEVMSEAEDSRFLDPFNPDLSHLLVHCGNFLYGSVEKSEEDELLDVLKESGFVVMEKIGGRHFKLAL